MKALPKSGIWCDVKSKYQNKCIGCKKSFTMEHQVNPYLCVGCKRRK